MVSRCPYRDVTLPRGYTSIIGSCQLWHFAHIVLLLDSNISQELDHFVEASGSALHYLCIRRVSVTGYNNFKDLGTHGSIRRHNKYIRFFASSVPISVLVFHPPVYGLLH